ncbi:MAG: hypothetical protein JJU36_01735 [Phycisphaeraceae bacterium]|nr:hypothetical protein [Phycisphaeraceae bacterium]
MLTWSTAELADHVADRLRCRAADDDLEQAVYGFDALDELGLHPLVHEAFREGGYGVWPEMRYPDDSGRSRRSEGKRCDVVLTPAPEALPLRQPGVKGTLFDSVPACDPEVAYWLEIKSVAQFETSGPFRRYSAELFSAVTRDLKKIWLDSTIMHGGLLLILFTSSETIAAHDLVAWHHRCLDKALPVGPPSARGFPLTDRIGNAWCQVAVFGVRGL